MPDHWDSKRWNGLGRIVVTGEGRNQMILDEDREKKGGGRAKLGLQGRGELGARQECALVREALAGGGSGSGTTELPGR